MVTVGASAEVSAFKRILIRSTERNGRAIVTKDEIDKGVSLMDQVLKVTNAYTSA